MKTETLTDTGRRKSSGTVRVRAGRTAVLSLVIVPLLVLATASTAFAGTGGIGDTGGTPTVTLQPGQGAAGSSVTLIGNSFHAGDSVQVGYSTGSCTSTVTSIAGATGTADSSGYVSVTFPWPATSTGSYVVCATDSTTHTTYSAEKPFTVLPSAAITASDPVYSGQPVTVSGKNFLPTSSSGDSVEVLYGGTDANPCANAVGTATVGSDGSFTATFDAPHADNSTPITIVAVEPQGSCGKTQGGPALQAQVNATVSPSPTIALSTMTSGQPATVTGKSFLPAGSTVEVDYGLGSNANACATVAGTAKVAADGSFSMSFKAPSVSKDTPITVEAVEPEAGCAQPKLHATAMSTVKAAPPGILWLQYCLVALLLLLLLLLLLFLLFRRRKQDEPVTIEERDRVFVSPKAAGGSANPGTPGGSALIDRQIIARDARGREVVIAEEVTTVEEEEEELH